MKKVVALTVLSLSMLFTACGPTAEKLPAAPADVASVSALVKGKKFVVTKAGLISPLSSPDNTLSIQWIDATVAGDFEKQAEEELKKFSIQFLNDTSVVVLNGDKQFEGTYSIDNIMDEYDSEEGIKIRLTYVDPEMSFGSEPMEATYTYPVKGAGDNKLLLQFPRSINRQPVVGLLTE
ncbi:MAG: hypothetical protein E6Q96_09995 [Cyclobacteriaceae bacterium]|nr:MAG: hypothetical protein E6Q96_09995 [Cyclobacteriaceae bacterium]